MSEVVVKTVKTIIHYSCEVCAGGFMEFNGIVETHFGVNEHNHECDSCSHSLKLGKEYPIVEVKEL